MNSAGLKMITTSLSNYNLFDKDKAIVWWPRGSVLAQHSSAALNNDLDEEMGRLLIRRQLKHSNDIQES